MLWTACLAGLCLATWLSWQYRFIDSSGGERLTPGPNGREAFQAVRAPDLIDWADGGQSVRIRAAPSGAAPTVERQLRELPRAEHIWTRIRASGDRLVPGGEDWQIARVMLLWRNETGGLASRQDRLCGLKWPRERSTFESVVRLRTDLGTPVIAFQNLAQEGDFTIHSLEIIPVDQRWWFPYAATLLALGWCVLTAITFRRCLVPGVNHWRIAPAAGAWVALAAFFLFPGPYYPWRPMLNGFELGEGSGGHREMANEAPGSMVPGRVAGRQEAPTSLRFAETGMPDYLPGEVLLEPDRKKDPVSVLFRWKKHIRALMHIGAFAAMVIGFSLLLGPARAWIPVALLGAGSELMQWLRGFGFDWLDIYDLLINGIGIAAGVIAVRMWVRWYTERSRSRKTSGC